MAIKKDQYLVRLQKGSWKTNALEYAKETPIALAMWVTIAIVVYEIEVIPKQYGFFQTLAV